jgi:2-oxoacid:acceptor oxidoreductase delta subunit (pyruvate/2-ketoisovalerate family)
MSDLGPRDISVSSTSTEVNRTGSWKYIRPVYHDRVAPCNERCPVGIDIEGYMNLLRQDRVDEAIDLLLRENPIPAITGRVCDHPCEQACSRCALDGAVAVHAVERMLGDRALDRPYSPPPLRQSEQVGVVGSGPAGLACAYHLARLGYAVTVFEAAQQPGGMLRLGIPEYRLPRIVLDRQLERFRELGVNFVCGVRFGQDLQWNVLSWFDAVFLAPGAHLPRALGIPGEDHSRVRQGLDFLADVNAGFRPDVGQRVLVIGGGNTAMDCARTARRLGADVTVMYRRTRAEMPAVRDEIEDAEREGVRLEFLAAPLAFRPADAGAVEAEFQRMVLGEADASGRRAPVPTDEHVTIRADLVLLATGENASIDSLPLEVDVTNGAIRVDALGATTVRAFFAGGDAAGHERTVAHALGAGKRAAIGIDRHLRERAGAPVADALATRVAGGNLSMTRWREDDPVVRVDPIEEVVRSDDLNLAHFAPADRHPDHKPNGETARTFAEANLGLATAEALAEARRCFNCGVCNACELCMIYCADVAIRRGEGSTRFEIDLEYCKGCGVCAEECPRGAISMTREGL